MTASGDDAFPSPCFCDPYERLVSLYRFSRLRQKPKALCGGRLRAGRQRSFGDSLDFRTRTQSMIRDATVRAWLMTIFLQNYADPARTLRGYRSSINGWGSTSG